MNESYQIAIDQEINRLNFIESKQGKDIAISFAKQVISQYRIAVLDSKYKKGLTDKQSFATLKQYRYKFILSYLVCKKYISDSRL